MIVCVVRGAERGARHIGAGVTVVSHAAKYRRVNENSANGHIEGSEDWSDSEEEFIIVNEKTELMEIDKIMKTKP